MRRGFQLSTTFLALAAAIVTAGMVQVLPGILKTEAAWGLVILGVSCLFAFATTRAKEAVQLMLWFLPAGIITLATMWPNIGIPF